MMESESQRSRIAKTSHSTGNEGWTSPHTKFNFWMSGVEAKKNTNFQRKKDHRRQNNRLFQEKFQPSSTKTTDGEIWKVTRKNFLYMKS